MEHKQDKDKRLTPRMKVLSINGEKGWTYTWSNAYRKNIFAQDIEDDNNATLYFIFETKGCEL